MPGVVDHDQARRVSKAIDDDIKVSLPDYLRATSSSSFAARKGSPQEKTETEKGCQGSVTSPSLPSPLYLILRSCHCPTGTRL
jgi:hypothetical protein